MWLASAGPGQMRFRGTASRRGKWRHRKRSGSNSAKWQPEIKEKACKYGSKILLPQV